MSEHPPKNVDTSVDLGRREVLKQGLNAAVALFVSAHALGIEKALAHTNTESDESVSDFERVREEERQRYEAELAEIPLPDVHKMQDSPELVSDILDLPLPLPDPFKLFPDGTGFVIVPTFHRGLLFKDGELVDGRQMPLGTAMTVLGYETPRGFFSVYRKAKSADYSSSEYPPPPGEPANMPWATFIDARNDKGQLRGIAIHGSRRFFIDEEGKEREKVDASHGCINMRVGIPDAENDAQYEDARIVQSVIPTNGQAVLILNNTHEFEPIVPPLPDRIPWDEETKIIKKNPQP